MNHLTTILQPCACSVECAYYTLHTTYEAFNNTREMKFMIKPSTQHTLYTGQVTYTISILPTFYIGQVTYTISTLPTLFIVQAATQ